MSKRHVLVSTILRVLFQPGVLFGGALVCWLFLSSTMVFTAADKYWVVGDGLWIAPSTAMEVER